MATNKTYKIDSFAKLMNVLSEDNFEALSLDFVKWMAAYLAHVKKVREAHPEETKNLLNWEITEADFEWIDDGANDLKEVVVVDGRTGEKVTVRVG
jgi:hypothetical protein